MNADQLLQRAVTQMVATHGSAHTADQLCRLAFLVTRRAPLDPAITRTEPAPPRSPAPRSPARS